MSIWVIFCINGAGYEYGITPWQKAVLAFQIYRSQRQIKSETTWEDLIIVINSLFKVRRSLQGDVVECGCYNGASTAGLSLACRLVKRRLWVCDSFKGLPEPKEHERQEVVSAEKLFRFKKYQYSSEFGLEGVKTNIERFGAKEVCEFVKGFYNETLKLIPVSNLVLIFEDCDLRSSVEDIVKYLWPRLGYGCRLFSHEAWSATVVSLFYDYDWWKRNLDSEVPGFHGSGEGMGYVLKLDKESVRQTGQTIITVGSHG